ncbi:MAG: hypothetical protein ACR2P5_06755 [Gammaproteobacteria bacterium]
MNLHELKNIGDQIEKRLIEIRESIGASLGIFSNIIDTSIEITGKQLQENAEATPGEPIIINDEYYIAYIKDNTYYGSKLDHDEAVRAHPSRCFKDGKKVHFYYCSTIVKMGNMGRRARYRQTREFRNEKIIDLQGAEDVETRLPWCKNCIEILHNESAANIRDGRYKSLIAEYGDAQLLMKCVIMLRKGEFGAAEKVRDFFRQTMERR